jgi:hypothetical protein
MGFQGLKVGDFLLNRECKRTRARVPVNANLVPRASALIALTEEVGQQAAKHHGY